MKNRFHQSLLFQISARTATPRTEQSALCCVSSCDLLVLSLAMYGALSEVGLHTAVQVRTLS
jgi:hypothetical protein